MPKLYEVYSGMEDRAFTTRSKRQAIREAQETANYKGSPQDVEAITIPRPSLALVLAILNETGYVTAREVVHTCHPILDLED